MGYATLAQARSWVEAGFGTCDKDALTEAVNTIRAHWFGWYQELSLFLDATECFALQTFSLNCNDCRDTYTGVTLPRDIQRPEALWWNDYPIRMNSSWREYQVGISPECDCQLKSFDMPGRFSTALDIVCGTPSKVKFRSFDPADNGKRLLIRGVDVTGRPFADEFQLSTDLQETGIALRSINAAGGIIKDITKGRVVLLDEASRVLGMYEPDETVPSMKRIKIVGLRSGCDTVNIRGSRQYFPLYGDDDVVESGNSAAFDAMGRYLRIYRKADKDGNDLKAEQAHMGTAFKLMAGDKAREVGKSTDASLVILTPPFGGAPRLNRMGRRF